MNYCPVCNGDLVPLHEDGAALELICIGLCGLTFNVPEDLSLHPQKSQTLSLTSNPRCYRIYM